MADETKDTPTTGEALGDAQKTQPKEFSMEKVGEVPPEKDAYVDSPNPLGVTIQTHDRDSVQPGPEPEGRYAPEAARKEQ